jgi:hypothetical protein
LRTPPTLEKITIFSNTIIVHSFLSFTFLALSKEKKKKPMLSDLFIGILKGFVKD